MHQTTESSIDLSVSESERAVRFVRNADRVPLVLLPCVDNANRDKKD
jgi:hypothetical protein